MLVGTRSVIALVLSSLTCAAAWSGMTLARAPQPLLMHHSTIHSIKMEESIEDEKPDDISSQITPAVSTGGLATVGATFEQLLGSLPAKEKYNAVILSLLSDESGSDTSSALDLVEEMTSKRILLSNSALKALIDSAVNAGDPSTILSALRATKGNGACRTFATPQLKLPDVPTSPPAELPPDSRGSEVGAAATFAAGVGGVAALEVIDFVDFTDGLVSAPPLPIVLFVLAAGWAADRYARQGEYASLIGRGLSRLFSRDLQRECAVESASFLLGYILGLPCCPFKPTVFKPLDMLAASSAAMEADIGVPARLVDRVLIWLMAPAALEQIVYRETLVSDPTLGAQFLDAARRREFSLGVDVQQGGWAADSDDARVRWAYSEAKRLLSRYSGVREVLQERMASGVSAGDCVVLIEDRLKGQWAAI